MSANRNHPQDTMNPFNLLLDINLSPKTFWSSPIGEMYGCQKKNVDRNFNKKHEQLHVFPYYLPGNHKSMNL